MADFQPTAAQAKVVNDLDRDILVSASAGAGKTTVLVARVLNLLAQKTGQVNIDNFLMVTFTKDAAKNMRDKIQRELQRQLDQTHVKAEQDRLKDQLRRLPMASISTIHSFCEQVIKRYYYVIGVDPKYRIVTDETELALLQERAWHDLENELLGDENPAVRERFVALKEAFRATNSNVGEGLGSVVMQLDREATVQQDANQWLDHLLDLYQVSGDDLPAAPFFTDYLKPQLERVASASLPILDDLEQSLPDYKPLAADRDRFTQLQALLREGGDWDQLAALVNGRLAAWRKPKDLAADEFAELKAARAWCTDQLQAFKPYFVTGGAQLVADLAQARENLAQLIDLAKRYRANYQGLKAAKHQADFGDLEHFAYAILTDRSPAGQDALATLQAQYQEIMVDEYQDTNALQDAIIKRLHAKGRNHLFMVGDVKQSIYRFRQADPSLFMGRQEEYATDGDATTETIELAENFRSTKTVTGLVNLVFSRLMDKQLGELDYAGAAELQYAAKWYEQSDQPAPAAELLVYDAAGEPTTDEEDAGEAAEPAEASAKLAESPAPTHQLTYLQQPQDKERGQIWLIGMRIKELLRSGTVFDGKLGHDRPITPGDIAILTRAKAPHARIVEQLGALGIPVAVAEVKNYLTATEVVAVLSLLKVIDNPDQDIPLVATLRSPLVGMAERELAFIRAVVPRSETFYAALTQVTGALADPARREKLASRWDQLAVEAPLAPGADQVAPESFAAFSDRLSGFLRLLADLQEIAERQSLVDLIWAIYQRTDYLDYVAAMAGGPQRTANLHAFYERANSYEQGNLRGLYQFIQFIERMQKRDNDLDQAPVQLVADAVNVMTIHKSKGLQFPVVILANLERGEKNETGMVIDPHVGVALSYTAVAAGDADRLTPYRYRPELPQATIVRQADQARNLAERMRLLYVALTRAEQRLILVAGVNGLDKQVEQWQDLPATGFLPAAKRQAPATASYLAWLGMACTAAGLLDGFNYDQAVTKTVHFGPGDQVATLTSRAYTAQAIEDRLAELQPTAEATTTPTAAAQGLTAADLRFLNQTLTFSYPHAPATVTTAYQSVSDLREAFATRDPDEQAMGRLDYEGTVAKERGRYVRGNFGQPDFLAGDQPQATTVGTATHLVFEQMPLDQGPVTAAMVDDLIARLLTQGLIESPTVAAQIDWEGIVAFYQTPLGQRLLANPNQVHREAPFSLLETAGDIFTALEADDGELLVHGIIDGYLETPDGIELFDYKTDGVAAGDAGRVQEIVNHYTGQLNLYARALTAMTGQPVIHRYLYLVKIGELKEL